MKAIIPVAGAGAKLRPHTYTQPKALIPIAGKTILSFIVDQLHEAGVHEFIFIVGYLGDKIQDYVLQTYPDLTCHFVQQNERKGTGHAVELTKTLIGNDEILVTLGDTICEYNLQEVLQAPTNMLGVKKVDDPRSFGVAEIGDDSFIEHVIEKPAIPKSNMALVGIYKIKDTSVLFECLEYLFTQHITSYGEYTLTDALDCMMRRGVKFHSFRVKNWFDCGKKETLLESNTTLLKKYGGTVDANLQLENSIIIPPVAIGPGCRLKNSIVGPHVSVGANTTVEYSVLRDSIIGSYTNLFEVVLDNSLIGSDASVKGLSRTLNIGDNTELDFG
ncbi:MAG: NTP transferase domain-containing protein [Parafilimonas sp.]|nr:NTP transferase domain-containing protein [Parafilimonas sp.]